MLIERLQAALTAESRAGVAPIAGDTLDLPGPDDGLGTPAAVLVPIVERPAPGLLLTVRSDRVRRHAGQIAFPGGRVDPGDEDMVDAALREAEEEVGLPRSRVRIVGIGDRYRTITGFDVTPVVGIVPPDLHYLLQDSEVADLFEAPLDYVLAPRHQVMRTVEWQGSKRSYYEIIWDGRRIWGATAAMIVNLSRRLAL